MKWIHNKNILIITIVIVLIIALIILSQTLTPAGIPNDKEQVSFAQQTELAADTPEFTTQPAITEAPTEVPAAKDTDFVLPSDTPESVDTASPTARPASGYVLVQTATQYGFLPLPQEGEYSVPVEQTWPDGSTSINLIHLTPEGVYMESSTCDNQNCVDEGIVTLENKSTRILGSYILCLPNQVTLQLFTPEELLEATQQTKGISEEE